MFELFLESQWQFAHWFPRKRRLVGVLILGCVTSGNDFVQLFWSTEPFAFAQYGGAGGRKRGQEIERSLAPPSVLDSPRI